MNQMTIFLLPNHTICVSVQRTEGFIYLCFFRIRLAMEVIHKNEMLLFSFPFSPSAMAWHEDNFYFYPILYTLILKWWLLLFGVSFMRMDLNRYGIDQTCMYEIVNKIEWITLVNDVCACSVQENSNINLTFVIWKFWNERHSSHIWSESNTITTKIRCVGLFVNKTHVFRFRIDFTFTSHHMI